MLISKNNCKSGDCMLIKTLLAFSYLMLISESQSFAAVVPISESLRKESISEYLFHIETFGDRLLTKGSFKNTRQSRYSKNLVNLSDQKFNIIFLTHFLNSLDEILNQLSYEREFRIRLQLEGHLLNSFERFKNGLASSPDLKKSILEAIIHISEYHDSSTTALNALQNQTTLLKVLTAYLNAFITAKQYFSDDIRLLSSLAIPNARSVQSNFIGVQKTLNNVSARIKDLFTEFTSDNLFREFHFWLLQSVDHELRDSVINSFSGSISGIHEAGGLPTSLDFIRVADDSNQKLQVEEYLHNEAYHQLIESLKSSQLIP